VYGGADRLERRPLGIALLYQVDHALNAERGGRRGTVHVPTTHLDHIGFARAIGMRFPFMDARSLL
jgi:hypothetical protein